MRRLFAPGEPFVRGVNLPWLSYGNDFGCNAWHPEGGLARAAGGTTASDLFLRLARAGAGLVRWFVLCDGRAGLCEGADGRLTGLDASVARDFDVAVHAAEDHGLALVPVLLDFHWCHPRRQANGVRLGGRARQISRREGRTTLLEQVLRPLLDRFGGRPGIAAWDLINEPEWVTLTWETLNPARAVRPQAMCDFIAGAAALVHACTDHPATVGLASAASLRWVRDLGLDLYQVHWYDQLDARAPLARPVSEWGADRPVLLGEFPTRGSRSSPGAIEARARASGYAGALAWSLRAEDEATDAAAVWRWLEDA
jgi:hypothetical protein